MTIPPMPARWWVSDPVMSDAFQVEMVQGDDVRGLWWGNQAVGHALRHSPRHECWEAIGRDDLPLPTETANALYPSADAALIRVRDAWRQRAVTISDVLGEDHWIEPRRARGVDSLWLGRIHLGYIRPAVGEYEAYTTNDDPVGTYPDHDEALLAVRAAWRAHLRRILRITRQPR
jgi:hypothetical protein